MVKRLEESTRCHSCQFVRVLHHQNIELHERGAESIQILDAFQYFISGKIKRMKYPVVKNEYRNQTCGKINVKNETFWQIIDTLRQKFDTIYQ